MNCSFVDLELCFSKSLTKALKRFVLKPLFEGLYYNFSVFEASVPCEGKRRSYFQGFKDCSIYFLNNTGMCAANQTNQCEYVLKLIF